MKYRVMIEHIDDSTGVAETRKTVFCDWLIKAQADRAAKFHNEAKHRRPMHPDLVIPGGSLYHEPDKFYVESYE